MGRQRVGLLTAWWRCRETEIGTAAPPRPHPPRPRPSCYAFPCRQPYQWYCYHCARPMCFIHSRQCQRCGVCCCPWCIMSHQCPRNDDDDLGDCDMAASRMEEPGVAGGVAPGRLVIGAGRWLAWTLFWAVVLLRPVDGTEVAESAREDKAMIHLGISISVDDLIFVMMGVIIFAAGVSCGRLCFGRAQRGPAAAPGHGPVPPAPVPGAAWAQVAPAQQQQGHRPDRQVELRTMAVQAQTTYLRHRACPRFQPLAEAAHGAHEEG